MPKKNLFITGATGFIGTELIKILDKNRYNITCLVRKSSNLHTLKSLGLTYIVGDLKDFESFEKHLKDIHTVIHLAANLGYTDKKNQYKDNVNGSRNLIRAAEKHQVKHFIQISTVAVAREYLGEYGGSKLLADKALKASKLKYTLLRPGLVIGKRSPAFNKFVRYIKKLPVVPTCGLGRNTMQIVHVEDVTKGILNTVGNKKAVGNTYYLCNQHPIRYRNYIKLIAKCVGVWKLIIPVPVFAVVIFAKLSTFFLRKSIITKDGAIGLVVNYGFDISKSVIDLKFRPMSNKDAVLKSL